MIHPAPITLERNGVQLEPMTMAHVPALESAAADGELWRLWYTFVPEPGAMAAYVERALTEQTAGHMLPWVVKDGATGQLLGTTRYHDIVAMIDRVEIGATWYRQSRHRTSLNTTCKLLLLEHAFDRLGCKVVGLRTDSFNLTSQRAIEALGARRDGVIRHHFLRRDGSVRDTVFYSILASEWPDVRKHLELRLLRHEAPKDR